MAIRIEVEPYCENCMVFDPDVKHAQKLYPALGSDAIITDTIVRCSKRNTCAGIKRYLEKEMQKGEKNDTKMCNV